LDLLIPRLIRGAIRGEIAKRMRKLRSSSFARSEAMLTEISKIPSVTVPSRANVGILLVLIDRDREACRDTRWAFRMLCT
jgi:hypothetical protein